jgi:hypothetical protein
MESIKYGNPHIGQRKAESLQRFENEGGAPPLDPIEDPRVHSNNSSKTASDVWEEMKQYITR